MTVSLTRAAPKARLADARLELDLARGRLPRLKLRGERPVGSGLDPRQLARLGQLTEELRQAALLRLFETLPTRVSTRPGANDRTRFSVALRAGRT